jgi:NTE family protein
MKSEAGGGMSLWSSGESGRLGLLLGAGGIRGCAHAGVLSVMDDLGMSADVVVGASIGSLFGAAYAAGWDVARISRLTELAPLRAVSELYRNRLRIDGSTYIGSIVCELGWDTRIEDLPRRFICMALDCASGKVVPLTKGPLLRSIEASIALPAIARPVTIGSATYIDGGLKGTVPAHVAREAGADLVIRVELSRLQAARARLRRPYGALLRAVTTCSLAAAGKPRSSELVETPTHGAVQEADADLVIVPEFYGLFCNSPVGIRFCARQGRRAARRALTAIDRQSRPTSKRERSGPIPA